MKLIAYFCGRLCACLSTSCTGNSCKIEKVITDTCLIQTLVVTEQGRSSTEVAKESGICIDTLRNWLKGVGSPAGEANRQNREQRRVRELEAENRTLRKQFSEKEEVIDVSKKSIGILSKP